MITDPGPKFPEAPITRLVALVTCGGPFDSAARSYRDNVIVWAKPAE
jgi:hypothetical protein